MLPIGLYEPHMGQGILILLEHLSDFDHELLSF